MARYQRPNIPYNPPEVLPNSNRYELIAKQKQPINSDVLDGESNYIINIANDLYNVMIGINAGVIYGANNPLNVGKFPITDGANPATISWSTVTEHYYANQSISTPKLKLGCVDNSILGDGSVTPEKIRAGAVTDACIEDGEISFDKIENANNVNFHNFFNSQDDDTLSLDPIIIEPNSIPGLSIELNSLPAAAIVTDSITRAQLAPAIKFPIGTMLDWAAKSDATLPAGWLRCSGQLVLKAAYADLYAIIGDIWGIGTATEFMLPDSRGRAFFGFDPTQAAGQKTGGRIVNGTVELGKYGGLETHALTEAENGPHTHNYTALSQNPPLTYADISVGVTFSYNAQGTTSSGLGTPHNNMSPYGLAQKIIYAGV
jgi:microcystin-dependent protein